MTEPSRASDHTQGTEARSAGPLDDTLAPPGTGSAAVPYAKTAAEPEFDPPVNPGEIGKIGRYRVVKKLGQGGMGAVYLGYDSTLGRKVALKVMLPEHAADPESRERFLREARAAAMINSDHVVTLYDVGEERGTAFLAMEYLQGYPLDHYLHKTGELPMAQVFRVAHEAALGLAAAHDLGFVHRDVKPGNIWLEAPHGRVKILDFGLARTQNDDTHLTTTGIVVGTPAFMSPEQARGLKLDGRSDLFSLGVVIYRLATGKMPFEGTTTMALLTSLAVDTPTPARRVKPEVPPALEAVIHKLLAKNPDERYKTAWEAATAIREAEHAPSTDGTLPSVVQPPPMAIAAQSDNVWEVIAGSISAPQVIESETDVAAAPVPVSRVERRPPAQKVSKLILALAGIAILVSVVAVAALAFVLIRPSKGTLFIGGADTDAELRISKDGEVIRERTRDREIKLEPGKYTVRLVDVKPGVSVTPDSFEIVANKETHIRITIDRTQPLVVKVDSGPDHDRKAAEYVVSIGGVVSINGADKDIAFAADLPKERFALTRVLLASNGTVHDNGLAVFKGCTNLTFLDLGHTSTSNAGLAHFRDCKNLVSLSLDVTAVDDDGMLIVRRFPLLQDLRLNSPRITDVALVHLRENKNLAVLDLVGTRVTDDGLNHLAGLTNLRSIVLRHTKVTDAGVAKFKQARPGCRIEWDGGVIEPQKK